MASMTTTPRRRPAGRTYPVNVNVRLDMTEHAFLHAVAEEHDCSISEATRLVLDAAIAREKFPPVASFKPDPAWLERHGERT